MTYTYYVCSIISYFSLIESYRGLKVASVSAVWLSLLSRVLTDLQDRYMHMQEVDILLKRVLKIRFSNVSLLFGSLIVNNGQQATASVRASVTSIKNCLLLDRDTLSRKRQFSG